MAKIEVTGVMEGICRLCGCHGQVVGLSREGVPEVIRVCEGCLRAIHEHAEKLARPGLGEAWFIRASTGRTCCSHKDHVRGPYLSRADAERRVASYKAPESEYWPLCSQYAKRGVYVVFCETVEALPGGRSILGGDRVLAPGRLRYIQVDERGRVADDEAEVWEE